MGALLLERAGAALLARIRLSEPTCGLVNLSGRLGGYGRARYVCVEISLGARLSLSLDGSIGLSALARVGDSIPAEIDFRILAPPRATR